MQSVKRLFSGGGGANNEPVEGSPPKKPRHQHKPTTMYTTNTPNPLSVSEDDFFASPHRSRRNGIVFEDITLLAQNMPIRSNSLPSRRPAINLADIDFSKLPHEWFSKAFAPTNTGHQQFQPADITLPPPSPVRPPLMKSPATVVPFISYGHFTTMRESVVNSLSTLPPGPGILKDNLLAYVFQSLSSLCESAEQGLKTSWGKTRKLILPSHFIDAIIFSASACNGLGKALTATRPPVKEVVETSARFRQIMALVVHSGQIVDALDILNLITPDARLNFVERLKRATEILISAARRFPIDSESTLLSIAQAFPSPLITVLLPVRFMAFEALIYYHLHMGMDFVESDSIVFKSTLEKVDRLRSTLKRIIKQYDRHSSPDSKAEVGVCRQTLKIIGVRIDLLKTFYKAISGTPFSKSAFELFKSAADLAIIANELPVQGECLYRMALVLVNNEGLKIQNITPNMLLISARAVNPASKFQAKVNKLLNSIRLQTTTALFAIAHNTFQERELDPFLEGVRVFVEILLMRHNAGGLDVDTVFAGDLVKGLLKVVRVFHPDKNAMADDDARYICEEVTKVNIMQDLPSDRVGFEQDDRDVPSIYRSLKTKFQDGGIRVPHERSIL
jgi:hypothetical protein